MKNRSLVADIWPAARRTPPCGFRVAPPGLLLPAQLLDPACTLTRYADAAKARGEPILEAKFRQRAHEMRIRAGGGLPG